MTGIPAGFADGVDNVSVVVSGTNIFAGDGLDAADQWRQHHLECRSSLSTAASLW